MFFKSICLYFGFLCCCHFGKNIYNNASAANKGHGSNPTATPAPPPHTHTHTHTHFLKWGEVNFDYLPRRGRESENFKKGVGSMVQGQVFLKGGG